jgi:NAD(P)H-flavin reductase
MNLQSGSAFKFSSLVNLQIRMPVVVIGGGLTAVDTATESAAYYLVQIEKFYQKYQKLGKNLETLKLNEEEKIIANEFITHALMAREELKNEKPNIAKLIDSFGGVKILYRKSIKDSPAYKNNHEELEKALEEGIKFFEYQELQQVIEDKFGHLQAIVTLYKNQGLMEIPAKTMLLAAGTSPNITLSEEELLLKTDGLFLRSLDSKGNQKQAERIAKPKENLFFTHLEKDFSISYFGDSHPSYAGNVVKAIASAKNGYKHINDLLESYNSLETSSFNINKLFKSYIKEINILSDNIVELIIYSPMSAKNFKPGQFFKLQNYPSDHLDCFEPLALTGAKVWPDLGLISLIILEMGGSSSLCRKLKIGEEVSLMGPTGEATRIQAQEKILLIGGGLGNAVLFSIGQKARELDCHVTYFAGYRRSKDLFKQEEIEKAADEIIWCFDEENNLKIRKQDKLFIGNLIASLEKHAKEKLINFDRIITIGSNGLMEAVSNFIKTNKDCTKRDVKAIASINSPMQCMMKEICAQCLQKHTDPISGLETYVYSCKNQDQDINIVDFKHLATRLKQNSLLEKTFLI